MTPSSVKHPVRFGSSQAPEALWLDLVADVIVAAVLREQAEAEALERGVGQDRHLAGAGGHNADASR
jgi:hypothetical protein